MKNHTTYKQPILTMFKEFRANNISLVELVQYLQTVDSMIRSKYKRKTTNKGIWFRYHKHDTLVTTPMSIYTALNGSSGKNNLNHEIECIDIAIANPKEFKVYFS